MFNIFSNHQTLSQRRCTTLHFHQPSILVQIFQALSKHLILYAILIIAVLVGVEWWLIMVVICISLRTNDVRHIFMCFLAICVSSLGKGLFRLFSYILFVLSFCCWVVRVLYIFRIQVFCQIYDLQILFFLLCGLFFHFIDEL